VFGSRFRRVQLGPELDMRRGLLGKGSMLTVTANADRTSPVRRGKWVLINILGVIPPDPPPSRILTHAVHGSAHDAVRHRARRAVRH